VIYTRLVLELVFALLLVAVAAVITGYAGYLVVRLYRGQG
jgi:hypothetical protein